MTHLVNAEIDGVPFADEHIHDASEIMGLMLVLFLGGVESTAGLVGTLFKLLAENPEQREILRANPELIPDAVEEAIRIATPLQLVGRTTSREVTLHGVTIPAGGRVVLVYGAANRDERRFADPDRFDVTRGKQRHLGFGEGMHGCIGAPLARLEAKIALEEALPLMGDYTITDVPERYKTTPNMYVWEHLHLAFPVTEAAHRDPRGRVETASHHTDTTVVTRELETEVRVAAKDERAEGVVALTLKTLDGAPLPEWAPGAHVDLVLGGGVPNRQYSLCGDVADRGAYRLGILRDADGGGGSRHVHDRLAAGDVVRVRGPRNNFALVPSPRYLFIAGGIGITPILPMIAAAEAAGAEWRLVYGGRTRASMAFLDELAAYGDRVTVCPQDETGLLDLATLLGTPEPDTLVYCCGPEPLLAAVEARCTGWPSSRAAPGAVRRPADGRARAGRGVRRRAGPQRPDPHRAAGALHPRRRRSGRGRRAVLVRRGHLRHVRDHRARRAARPPRLRAHGGRAGREQLHADLRLPLLHRPAGARPLIAASGTGRPSQGRWRRARRDQRPDLLAWRRELTAADRHPRCGPDRRTGHRRPGEGDGRPARRRRRPRPRARGGVRRAPRRRARSGSYAEVLADPEVDVVYNPLANALHGPLNRAAIAAGKHVLSEKPFAANAAEAHEVRTAAEVAGVTVVEAFHYVHHPLPLRLREVVRSGELGPIRRIETAFRMPAPPDTDPAGSSGWRAAR